MRLQTTGRAALDRACPPSSGRRIGGLGPAELRDYGPAGLVWRALHFGDHHVSADGACVASVPGEPGWEVFLGGQVLPLCAALHGLEPLHAAAAAIDGGVLALAGPSGAGKSTLLAALVERGGAFFSDDVLAIESDGDLVLAHPGPGVLKLRAAGRDERRPEPAAAGPLPLRTLVLLERGDRPAVEPERLSVPALLGANFVPVLDDPRRLERLLGLCASAAASVRCLRASVPAGGDPGAVADLLLEALG